MLSLKPGVSLQGLQPQTVIAVMVAEWLFDGIKVPCVITSGHDSNLHKSTSLHYKGLAVDIRLPSFYNGTPELDKIMSDNIRLNLGKEYDVVLEKDHIHVEYDPKPVVDGGIT